MRKILQNHKGSQKSARLAILALGILFLVVFLGKSTAFLTSLQKPLNLKSEKQYSWNGKSSLNLIYVSLSAVLEQQISVITIDPNEKKATILSVPNKAYAQLPKDFGWWEVGSIYKLGQEENPPIGGSLLKLSLSKLLGLPVDGIIILNSKDPKTAQSFIERFHSNPIYALTIMPDIKTDLTPNEIFQTYQVLTTIRSDKIISLNLERSDITESKLLKDSSRVLGVDNVKLDLYIRQNLADSKILEEGKSIAVLNGTDNPGIAAEAARVIANMGGNVVIISSADEKAQQSGVYSQAQDGGGMTKDRLTQIFAPRCLNEKCTSTDAKITNSRAQITIVLGEDYFKFWHAR